MISAMAKLRRICKAGTAFALLCAVLCAPAPASGGTLTLQRFVVSNLGTWTPGSDTVVLTADNTLPSGINTFNNLIVNGGTTTLGQNTMVSGALTVSTGTLNTAAWTLGVAGNF